MTTVVHRHVWLVGLAFLLDAVNSRAQVDAAAAKVNVTVTTQRGRQLSGVVDARTDDEALWLRQEATGIVLATAVAWPEVANATVDGRELDPTGLRAEAAEMATTSETATSSKTSEAQATATRSATGFQDTSISLAGRRPRVQNIDIVCAALANFDRDVEPDGIELALVARDERGRPVTVRGSLRAELYGERRPLYEPQPQFNELDRWTEPVRPEQFVDGVAVYRLPFRNTAPEWQFDLLPDAVLTIDLGAAGHGNFSASAPVVLRQFNPLRDNLQQEQGVRFLPTELERSRPLGPFGPQLGRWHHWTR